MLIKYDEYSGNIYASSTSKSIFIRNCCLSEGILSFHNIEDAVLRLRQTICSLFNKIDFH